MVMLCHFSNYFNLQRRSMARAFRCVAWVAGLIVIGLVNGAEYSFPLRASHNHHFLVDQQERPFLVVGDTAWSLIADLNVADAKRYLDDRQAKGFNSILVNLIEHKFASKVPRNYAGVAPFQRPESITQPNDAYFAHAQFVVREANKRGIVVWLAPAYLGYGGGDEGWFKAIKTSGLKALRDYGRYLGERFKDSPNLIWVLAGDFTPLAGDQWTVDELAAGIREEARTHLITAHGSPGQSAVVSFPNRSWLGLNMAYSYDTNLYNPLLAEYRHLPALPFVLLECTYENEHDSKPEQIRRQAYWAMLSGACGQFFGNNPIWHFDGPGLFKAPGTWREALDSQGSQDMARLKKAFADRAWQELEPDLERGIVVDGTGTGTARVITAATPDRRLAMSYLPSTGTEPREISVNLGHFSGPVAGQWFNPVSGISERNSPEPLPNQGRHTFKTPGDNGSKANDWLLILEVVR
jgi:hypothetical protein